MIELENTEVLGWEHAIRGMRNPLNSWEKSDSAFDCIDIYEHCDECPYYNGEGPTICKRDQTGEDFLSIGPNDRDLMMRLAKGGPVHAKYRRMIVVYVDITAPLYWWKEFDTYRVGVEKNSCSTMHKIAAKEFTLEDFSCEHLVDREDTYIYSGTCEEFIGPKETLEVIVDMLNESRREYLETKDKRYWWQMIQLLPSSYNQKRTVMLNYEVLAGIYPMRKDHKLDEWRELCKWIEGLPYSEIITVMSESEKMLRIGEKLHDGFKEGLEHPDPDIIDKWNSILGGYPVTPEEIEHLVDVTCSWDVEDLGGDRLYAIGPGFTREDLTPYELRLLEKSEAYEKKKKE